MNGRRSKQSRSYADAALMQMQLHGVFDDSRDRWDRLWSRIRVFFGLTAVRSSKRIRLKRSERRRLLMLVKRWNRRHR